jgi:hypothetical protein
VQNLCTVPDSSAQTLTPEHVHPQRVSHQVSHPELSQAEVDGDRVSHTQHRMPYASGVVHDIALFKEDRRRVLFDPIYRVACAQINLIESSMHLGLRL